MCACVYLNGNVGKDVFDMMIIINSYKGSFSSFLCNFRITLLWTQAGLKFLCFLFYFSPFAPIVFRCRMFYSLFSVVFSMSGLILLLNIFEKISHSLRMWMKEKFVLKGFLVSIQWIHILKEIVSSMGCNVGVNRLVGCWCYEKKSNGHWRGV